MKKAITLALALVLALSLAACGGKDTGTGSTGGNSNTPSGSSTTNPPASTPSEQPADNTPSGGALNPSDINTENWRSVVKDFGGFDIELPDGWAVTEATGSATITVKFTVGGSVTADDFGSTLFDATKAVSVVQPYNNNGNAPYDSYGEATGDGSAGWSYKFSDSFMDVRALRLTWSGDVCELYIG